MTAISLVEKETPNLMVSCCASSDVALNTDAFGQQRANMSLTVPELTSFLVLPIQRLCRYPLLLEVCSFAVFSSHVADEAILPFRN